MTEKQYIRQVERRLLCKPEQKQELLMQLESDIRAAVAEGETPEAVFARMGRPEKIAAEFNGSFSEEEKRAVQKRKITLLAVGIGALILAALVLGFYWMLPKAKAVGKEEAFQKEAVEQRVKELIGYVEKDVLPKVKVVGKEEVFQKEAVEQRAKELIGYVEKDDYQALYEAADEAMQKAMGEADFGEALFLGAKQQISDDWGVFRSYGTPYFQEIEQQGKSYAALQLNVSYENTSVTYTIMLDEKMRLNGLYMK